MDEFSREICEKIKKAFNLEESAGSVENKNIEIDEIEIDDFSLNDLTNDKICFSEETIPNESKSSKLNDDHNLNGIYDLEVLESSNDSIKCSQENRLPNSNVNGIPNYKEFFINDLEKSDFTLIDENTFSNYRKNGFSIAQIVSKNVVLSSKANHISAELAIMVKENEKEYTVMDENKFICVKIDAKKEYDYYELLSEIVMSAKRIIVFDISERNQFNALDSSLLFRSSIEEHLFDLKIACWVINSSQAFDTFEDCFNFCSLNLQNLINAFKFNKTFNRGLQVKILKYFSVNEILAKAINSDVNLSNILWKIEMPICSILHQINSKDSLGFVINCNLLQKYDYILNKEIRELESEANNILGYIINLRSPLQIKNLIYDRLELDKIFKEKTQNNKNSKIFQNKSTGEEVLRNLLDLHPIIKIILLHRKMTKTHSTYVEPFLQNINRLSIWHQTKTITGRISCSEPNIQTIPKHDILSIDPKYDLSKEEYNKKERDKMNVRNCFECKPGKLLLSVDFKQVELRVCAQVSNDESLIQDLCSDKDFFIETACKILQKEKCDITSEEREKTKTLIYGWVYGCSKSASEIFSCQNLNNINANWIKNKYPGLVSYSKTILNQLHATKRIESIMGRIRHFNTLGINKKQMERQAINCKIDNISKLEGNYKYFSTYT